uniref:Uncharacterized protein n=1 Tax=Anopheles maculatus TaxID=74869 RepID=A0A182SZ01_9DIPT
MVSVVGGSILRVPSDMTLGHSWISLSASPYCLPPLWLDVRTRSERDAIAAATAEAVGAVDGNVVVAGGLPPVPPAAAAAGAAALTITSIFDELSGQTNGFAVYRFARNASRAIWTRGAYFPEVLEPAAPAPLGKLVGCPGTEKVGRKVAKLAAAAAAKPGSVVP